jgi:DNA polymerase-3 subunit delta
MLRIEEEIKKNQISRFHLLYGEERYMVRYYKKLLVQKLSQPDDEMNRTFFRDKSVEPSQIAEAAQVLPFFAEHRLLVVEDSGFFKSSNDMADYMEAFPDTTYLIFVEREIDKRNRLFKWVNKNGCVTECVPQQEKRLRQWIAGYVKKAGKSITGAATELLLERVGTDMELLSNELEKCIGYAGERTEIEVEDVAAISSGVTVSKIFDMIDAVALGEKDRALHLYDDLLANKEAPMSILYLFSRHINILLQIKECDGRGLSAGEIAKKCGIPPFTVSKYRKQASLFSRKKLLAMLEGRLTYEESFKTGKLDDQLAVELFFIQALTAQS